MRVHATRGVRLAYGGGGMLADVGSAARVGRRRGQPGSRSDVAARMLSDLLAAPVPRRRRVLAALDQADLAALFTISAQELGTPYAVWQGDPIGFATQVLGEALWSGQRKILRSMVTHQKTAIPSCFASGKCVLSSDVIQLADGRVVEAKDLVGTSFEMVGWAEDGTQTPRRAWAQWNAVEPIYRVTTTSGRTISRNAAHPLWSAVAERKARPRRADGSVSSGLIPTVRGWTPVAKLKAGDLVLVPEHVHTTGTRQLPPGQAALLGYLLGDGSTRKSAVEFAQLPGPALDEFVSIVEQLGGRVAARPVREGRKHLEFSVHGHGRGKGTVNPILNLCREWGMSGCTATSKRFPAALWDLHPDQLAVVAGRLFSCDGYVHIDTRTYTSKVKGWQRPTNLVYLQLALVNEGLVRDFQRIMLRLGVPGAVTSAQKRYEGKPFTVWKWTVSTPREIARFAEIIDAPAKNEQLRRAVEVAAGKKFSVVWQHRNAPAGYRWEKVTEVTELPPAATVAIEVEHDHTWVDLFVEHNTRSMGLAAAYWASVYPPGTAVAVTIAPRWRQVARQIWPEIRGITTRANLFGQVDTTQWKIPTLAGKEYVAAYGIAAAPTAEDAVQGIHAPHLLLIVDEAGGISETIGRNMVGLLTGDNSHMVAIGNPPTDNEGSWFERLSDGERANLIRIDAYSTPNFTGEATALCRSCPPAVPPHPLAKHLVDQQWVDDVVADHGADSRFVEAKVHARFPRGGPNTLVPWAWVDAAVRADEPDPDAAGWVALNQLGLPDEKTSHLVQRGSWVRLGVDVAADGGDELAIARCVGNLVTIERTSAGSANSDGVRVAGMVLEEIRRAQQLAAALRSPAKVRVKIDVIGIGWGVWSLLKRWGEEGRHQAEIVPVDVREAPRRTPDGVTLRPAKKRDEMWLAMRALLATGAGEPLLRLRVDDRTAAQLSAPRYTTNSTGHTVVETKDSMRKRGVRSPDRAEACNLAVYEPQDVRGRLLA